MAETTAMDANILVINPNSNTEVTRAINAALDPLRTNDAPNIRCITVAEGPRGVETQADADMAAPLVVKTIKAEPGADAYVIACYSDPGLRAARETTSRPVFGIAESGIAAAVALGGKIGVVSILDVAVERHWNYVRASRLEQQIVADLPVGLAVADLSNEAATETRMLATGKRLRDEYGARTILLGCAGMARYRRRMQDALGMIVIDPTQAAVAAAIIALRLGYDVAKRA
jgi:allantoin racemase